MATTAKSPGSRPARQPVADAKSSIAGRSLAPVAPASMRDSRPDAIALRRLEQMLHQQVQPVAQRALQARIDNSPRMVAQRQQCRHLFGGAVHQPADVIGATHLPIAPAHLGARVPVQRALNMQILGGYAKKTGMTRAVGEAVHNYNQHIRDKSITTKIGELNALQTLILNWFDQNKDGDLDDNEMARKMKLVLNDLQSEHEKVVRSSLVSRERTPPVAGFDALSDAMQAEVSKIWNDLINSTGNVVITEKQNYKLKGTDHARTKTHEGFADQALAAFARLLETGFGRTLLIRANQDTGNTKTISIRPGNSLGQGEIPSEEFIATASEQGEGELTEVTDSLFGKTTPGSVRWRKIRKGVNIAYPVLTIPADADEAERIHLIHNAPQAFSGKAGYRIKNGGQWRYFKFNEGTGSQIVFATDIQDSSDHMTSRFIDFAGNEIIVPVFITLAHELGHALHMLEGNVVGRLGASLGSIVAPGERFEEWSNLEEYQTIKGVENSVRKQAAATERFGHDNFLSYTATQVRVGPMQAAYDATDALQEPAKAEIDALLSLIQDALGSRDISRAKKLLKSAQKKIEIAQASLLLPQQQEEDQDDDAQPPGASWLDFWPFK